MAEHSRRWWVVNSCDLGWGDYGRALVTGLTWNLDRTAEGLLQLERTGPFVPPVTVTSWDELLGPDYLGPLHMRKYAVTNSFFIQ